MKIKKDQVQAVLKLSPMQQGIMLYYLSDPRDTTYFEQLCLKVNGQFEKKLFIAAWNNVVKKHDMLRTVFRWKELNEPIQIILKDNETDYRFHQIPTQYDVDAFLTNIMNQDLLERMDLERVPFRVNIIIENTDTYYVLLSHHHILYDGWSNSLIVNDFFDVYKKMLDGKDIPVSKNGSFVDYINYLENTSQGNATLYWKKHLKDYQKTNIIEMQSDKTKTLVKLDKVIFSEEETEEIQKFCRNNNMTVSSLLYASLGLCLYQNLACPDYVIGITVSGRNIPIQAIAQMVGLFIQTIPLRFKCKRENTLLDFVKKINNDLINSIGNEIYSLADIKRSYEIPTGQELFDVIAIIENYPIDQQKLISQQDLQIRYYASYDEKASAPLCIEFRSFKNIEVHFKYQVNHISKKLIKEIVSSYSKLLMHILRQPNSLINEIISDNSTYKRPVTLIKKDLCKSQNQVENQEAEKTIKAIWADILKIDTNIIRSEDNFFDLGGHSLKITYLILRLQKEFHIDRIKPSQIYSSPTVSLMADLVCSQKKGGSLIPLQPSQPYYEVTPSQKGLYFFQKLYPSSVQYNMVEAYIVDGKLNHHKLVNALTLLCEKHESLRTTFITKNGEVFQRVHSQIETPLCYIQSEGKMENQIIQEFIMPFDLSELPLIKVGVAQFDSNRHLIIFQLHHIISDGISNQILMQDFLTAYNGENLEQCNTSYKDFAAWKLKQDRTTAKKYWQERLPKDILKTDITPSCIKNEFKNWRGQTIRFSLNAHKYNLIKQIASRHEVSLFSLLFSSWLILLNKLTNQDSIITSTVSSGRTHFDIEKTVGLFINTLPFYMEISSKQQFSDFLLTVNQIFLQDIDHQDYALSDIVNTVCPDRNLDENPLFNTMFVMQNMQPAMFDLPGLIVKKLPIEQCYTKYDLTLFAQTEQNELLIDIEYRTDLFSDSLASLFLQYYVTILDEIIKNENIPLCDISIVCQKQKQYLLHEWNSSIIKIDTTKTVQSLFNERVCLEPNKVAVIDNENHYTYVELNNMANNIAHSLRNRGVKQGDIVAVYMDNSVKLIAGILGILKIGATYLPLDIETPHERLIFILKDSQCCYLLKDFTINIDVVEYTQVWNIDYLLTDNDDKVNILEGNADDIIYIIYTSGTTGQPKGCLIQQKGVSNYLQWAVSKYYRLSEPSIFAFFSSPAFDLSITSIFSPIICGQTIAVYQKRLDAIHQIVLDNRCNIIKMTPTQLSLFLGSDHRESSVKTIIVGGEQFSTELAEKAIKALGPDVRIFNEYGPTETVVGCMIHQYNPAIDTGYAVPIGIPAANMHIYLLDNNMKICPVGVKGEIYISGIGVSPGYLNHSELTKRVFITHQFNDKVPIVLYKTGDIGVLSEYGLLYYCGRLDSQVKISGFRIEIEEVRQTILQIPGVRDAFVLAKEGKINNKYLCAYCVSNRKYREIKNALEKTLPYYMIPSHFYFIDRIPVTPAGKIDTTKLLSLDGKNANEEYNIQKVSNTVSFLQQLWIRYLDVEQVALEDNFFDIGGSSFILLKMHEDLSIVYPQVNIADYFKYPTIKSMAKFIHQKTNSRIIPSLNKFQPTMQPNNSVAVIGIGVVLPKAKSLWELKDVFINKLDCISPLPLERKNDLIQYLTYLGIEEDSYEITEAAFLERIDRFDYKFFKMTKSEAELMDPYHRILFETVQHALEDAGYKKGDMQGSNTGVYVGQPHPTNYYDKVKKLKPEMTIVAGPGNVDSIMAGRISYYYDLKGPSMLVNTACSSSLSALHLACQAIQYGEIDMGLVAGINLIINPTSQYGNPIPDIVSSTARARTFSEDSDGTGRGEGCIVVLVKQYEKAVYDHDNIYAVIKSTHLNNDGKSIGITAPNMNMQESAIQNALEKAEVTPDNIGYIESHGTGTTLGDPIEVAALTNVFSQSTEKKQFCALGAAKTNYGHLDSAAGLLGFIKAISCLYYKKILPNINMTYPNTKIDFIRSPFYLPTETQNWNIEEGHLRHACVSAFGLSGTNCHVVLEEHDDQKTKVNNMDLKCFLFVISAKSKSALQCIIREHLNYVKSNKHINLLNVCYTSQVARDHYKYRGAIICYNIDDLIFKLSKIEQELFTDLACGIYFYKEENKEILKQVSLKSDDMIKMDEEDIVNLAQSYVNMVDIDWNDLYKNVEIYREHIPTYSFDPLRCWIDSPITNGENNAYKSYQNMQIQESKNMNLENPNFKVKLLQDLISFVAKMFDEDFNAINKDSSFIELGIDSITIIQLKQYIEATYGIEVAIDKLFNEWNTLELLAEYMSKTISIEEASLSGLENKKIDISTLQNTLQKDQDVSKISSDILGDINTNALIAKQLEIMEKQLEILQKSGFIEKQNTNTMQQNLKNNFKLQSKDVTASQGTENNLENYHNHAMRQGTLDSKQLEFLQKLIKRYTTKTTTSKQLAEKQKETWANGRFVMGFSKPWKEMLYPIYASRGKGSKIWDEDGNEYIDFAMGFGVHLFGHDSPIISKAIKTQVDEGVYLGPLNTLSGEVAKLISDITGSERVAFCNSGTEAIMNLMRLARATTGKNKIAIFSGAFHGTFDGVYMTEDLNRKSEKPIPYSLGTPQTMAEDIIIIPYGEDESLDILSIYKDELAAVLVEPIQSRNPDLQPVDFLRKLRSFTTENNIALIFDEIITGFRVHPGGLQAYFGIKADLVAYGKVIGGGMPIGVFAGDKKYMDKVDGGYWLFGDDSGPYTYVAQTGGTFRGHSLTMASAKAVLTYIIEHGTTLQDEINEKTRIMAEYLNNYFINAKIPIKIAYFGSLFVFKTEDTTLLRFLFYMLIEKGIYIWEGGTCFISFSHSEADLCTFVFSVQEIFKELVLEAGYDFKIPSHIILKNDVPIPALSIQMKRNIERCLALVKNDKDYKKMCEWFAKKENVLYIFPVTSMQNRILTQNLIYKAAHQDISLLKYIIQGELEVDLFQQAWNYILDMHPILKTGFIWRKLNSPVQIIYNKAKIPFEFIDLSMQGEQDTYIQEIYNRESIISFDNDTPPLIKVILLKLNSDKWCLIIKYQNSLFDGWSSGIILNDLLSIYRELSTDNRPNKPQEYSLLPYVEWLQAQNHDQAMDFWKTLFFDYLHSNIAVSSYEIQTNFNQGLYEVSFSTEEIDEINIYTKMHGLTNNTLFQGAWGIHHCQLFNIDDLLIATVTSGRPEKMECIDRIAGVFSNIVPVRIQYKRQEPLDQWLKSLQSMLLSMKQFDYIPIDEIVKEANLHDHVIQDIVYSKTLVYLNYPSDNKNDNNGLKVQLEDEQTYINVPLRVYIEPFNNYRVITRYDRNFFNDNDVSEKMEHFKSTLLSIIKNIKQQEGVKDE